VEAELEADLGMARTARDPNRCIFIVPDLKDFLYLMQCGLSPFSGSCLNCSRSGRRCLEGVCDC
jgi:hypothetical protein